MKDTDLYSWILGLAEPWFVQAVVLNTVEGRVDTGHPHDAVLGREVIEKKTK